jgi:hypothetical protein
VGVKLVVFPSLEGVGEVKSCQNWMGLDPIISKSKIASHKGNALYWRDKLSIDLQNSQVLTLFGLSKVVRIGPHPRSEC